MVTELVRKDFNIRRDQIRFLDRLPGITSEHVRLAIDDYILKKKTEGVSQSPSKRVVNL